MSATIVLYSPGTHSFTSETGLAATTDQGRLLLNILIELRVHTQYLAAMNQNVVPDNPQALRDDIVAHGAYV